MPIDVIVLLESLLNTLRFNTTGERSWDLVHALKVWDNLQDIVFSGNYKITKFHIYTIQTDIIFSNDITLYSASF